MQAVSLKIASSPYFQNFITIAILLAGILVGVSTYHGYYLKHQGFLEGLNNFILYVFIVEVIVKILAEGKKPWNYFKDGWNVFDFIIVATAFMPFGGNSIAILRLLRLLRVLKLIKALPKLQILVSALLKSIPSMAYVSLLLFLLFYIYAVAAVFFFGGNDPVHFDNLEHSMLTMFRVVTLEDWTDVMYINMYGCENYGYDGNEAMCKESVGYPLLSALFFVSFVLVGTMIFLNLFVGVIMTGMEEARKEMDENLNSQRPHDQKMAQIENKLTEIQDLVKSLK